MSVNEMLYQTDDWIVHDEKSVFPYILCVFTWSLQIKCKKYIIKIEKMHNSTCNYDI